MDDPRWYNPDCLQGKHRACAGDAWNEVDDEPAVCGCTCHEHQGDQR